MATTSSTNLSSIAIAIDGEGRVISPNERSSDSLTSKLFLQKLFAELLGTYIVVFAGTTAIVTNLRKDNLITHPGVAMTWGLAVTVMVYTLGHISQAHFNPAVTIAQATCKRFPLKQVPAYIIVQIFGSTLASGTVRLLFGAKHSEFPGSMPAESDFQSLILEFIITFILLFVISGVSTDNRAVKELGGIAAGATILLNVLIAGLISGSSMNPARSLGAALVYGRYEGLWVYFVGPILGAIFGAWAYNATRTKYSIHQDK